MYIYKFPKKREKPVLNAIKKINQKANDRPNDESNECIDAKLRNQIAIHKQTN